MWTKDYLVRGFVRRQRCRPWGAWQVHGAADYADEWQALYRVEDARRRLKTARAAAQEQRAAVLAWDAAATRDGVAAAAQAEARRRQVAALRVTEAREAEVRRQRDAAGRGVRVLEARKKAAAAKRAAVVSRKFWAAWVQRVRSQSRPRRPLDMGGPRDQWLSFELGVTGRIDAGGTDCAAQEIG
jgi:hypothetical protein